MNKKHDGPKILFLDIETSPYKVYTWSLHGEMHIAGNQVVEQWNILSWAAKFQHVKKMQYSDQRNAKDVRNEKAILSEIRDLLDEADIIIGHNVQAFDLKKLKTRFIKYGIKPPSSYKVIDTLKIARKHFNFPSNKLEELAEFLGCKLRKVKSKKFPGFKLWDECLEGNKAAFKEMEVYNKGDVDLVEEVYKKLIVWEPNVNFAIYYNNPPPSNFVCACGSTEVHFNGHAYGKYAKRKRYSCAKCGTEVSARKNLAPPPKKFDIND